MTKTISEVRGKIGDKTLSKNRKDEDTKIASIVDAAELVLKDYFANGIPKQHLMLNLKKSLDSYQN
jgi:hypothetical protein